jgi:hypothetical protein
MGGKVVSMLKSLPAARGRWVCVGVVSISDVPTSLRGYDCILTLLDHISNSACQIPWTKTMEAAEFAW